MNSKIIVFAFLLLGLTVGFSGCKKDDAQSGGGSSSGGNNNSSVNALVGKWSYPDIDPEGEAYTGYWIFNSDGTMTVNDKEDLLNGATTPYTYNADSKKLTLGGFLVYQLVWISSTKFKIEAIGENFVETTYTKVQ